MKQIHFTAFYRRYWGILWAVIALSIFPAHAIASDDCGTPAQITERLKAEGQRSFAMADKVERTNDLNTLYGMVFTTNADMSVGYILQSDQPTEEPATQFCIYKRLENIRLFDARKPGINPATLLKTDEAEAHRRCDELIKSGKVTGVCGSLNSFIRDSEPFKERVMFQGFITEKQADGSYKKDGTLATITGNIGGSMKDYPDKPLRGIVSAILFSSLPDGTTVVNMFTVYAEYLPYGVELLGRQGQ
ncbi:hypothetical protein ACPA2M_08040 [Ectopseudomonas chengduensis]